MAEDTLVVNEVFGPTFQGEGPSTGVRAGFVRLGRCNLACTWCDTPHSWDWSRHDPAVELHERSVASVVSELSAMQVGLVVVTGGEPLLQQHRLAPLIDELHRAGMRVEVETNGTIAPELAADQWNVSPKLANSGMPLDRRLRPDALAAFEATDRAIFKFVARGREDLDEIAGIVAVHGLSGVWVMPEGTDAATIEAGLRDLASLVLERGWNLTPRLHVLVWGDRRGV